MKIKRVANCGLFMHEARCNILGTERRTHERFNLDSSNFNYEDIKKADEEGIVRNGKVYGEPYKIVELTYRRYNDWTSPSHLITYAEFYRMGKPRRLALEVKVEYTLEGSVKSPEHFDYIRLDSVEPEGDRKITPWFAGEQL